jgi:hypothetical protein
VLRKRKLLVAYSENHVWLCKTMKMDRQEIHSAILNFLGLLENGEGETPTEVETLALALDKLALVSHFLGDIPADEQEYPEASARSYSRWRELIGKRFPSLGYYNIPSTITVNIGEAEIHTGDALDDLADIANELSEFAWRWQNNSENDALWYFQFSYETHWGSHLRGLQMYLHALRSEK